MQPKSRSGNSFSGSTGHWPTALELEESTALFSLSFDAGGGEGRGEEPRFYWISPLPNPLPARSSRGEGDRRSTFQWLIQWQWATGLCRTATRRTERGSAPGVNKDACIGRRRFALPGGGSPTGAGELPVLPIFRTRSKSRFEHWRAPANRRGDSPPRCMAAFRTRRSRCTWSLSGSRSRRP